MKRAIKYLPKKLILAYPSKIPWIYNYGRIKNAQPAEKIPHLKCPISPNEKIA